MNAASAGGALMNRRSPIKTALTLAVALVALVALACSEDAPSPSSGGALGGGGGASGVGGCDHEPLCAECVDCALLAPCAKQSTDCDENPDCIAMKKCAESCTADTASCVALCQAAHALGFPGWDALETCTAAACPTPCGAGGN